MTRSAWHRFRRNLGMVVLAASAACGLAASAAELAIEYTYDDAGRLKKVVAPELESAYTLDAAGNRTSVVTTTGRGWPSSLNIPETSLDGNYTISWGASTGSATNYKLYESITGKFDQPPVYDGTALSRSFSNRPDGYYHYQVRACDATGCGPPRTSFLPMVVQRPPMPGVPGALTIPTGDIDGAYSVSWGASTGTVTAYELYQATNSAFTGQTLAYSGTAATAALSGRGNGTYYYRVRACNTSISCTTYSTGTNSILVTLPPSVPGTTTVPSAYSNTGSYTVSWGASTTGIVTAYQLLEYVTFGSETQIYSGTNTSFPVSGRGDATYGYRVRACNGPACSAYNATQGNGAVVMVDKVAPQPPTSLNRTGQTHLFWSGGSTDSGGSGSGSGVDRWRVYRSGTLVATVIAPMQAFNDSAAPSNQTYTYTVRSVDRAGNESTGAASLTVFVDTLPPNAPTGVSAVGASPQSINISWTAATDPNGGTVSGYFVYRNGANPQIASGTSFVDTGLSPSTTYTYTVSAYDSAGNVGPLSAPANGTTQAPIPTVPLVPTNVGISTTRWGHPSYTVYWTGSGAPTSYYVLEENGATSNVTGGFTSKAFSSKPVGFYNYRVKACSATNVCSAWSDPVVSYEVCGTGGCM